MSTGRSPWPSTTPAGHRWLAAKPIIDIVLAVPDSADEAAKRALAARRWTLVQHYADAKGEVVEGIIARAMDAPPR